MLTSYRCQRLFPGTGPPIENGTLTVNEDVIVSIGGPTTEKAASTTTVDLGDNVIVPRFVNAHTHLEFSQRTQPFGSPGMPFYEWIEEVVRSRREAPPAPDSRAAAYRAGSNELRRTGTLGVGEIATPGWPANELSQSLTGKAFLELLGLKWDRVESLVELAEQHLAECNLPAGWAAGLSPHAPYTVHPQLLSDLCDLSAQYEAPVAMHLAESFEELELVSSGSGPFVEMLERLDAWDPTAIPRGTEMSFYLSKLATAHRALVIHGNFLQSDDWTFLAERPHMSLVYCPRTHDYFQHGDYPLPEVLEHGVRVALGTDSRASNPDLDLLQEMKFLAARYELDPQQILNLGTLAGAEALGMEQELGSLEAGKRPLAAVVTLGDQEGGVASSGSKPGSELFHEASRVTHLIDGHNLEQLA